ncbi:hypothetical protein [Lacticaseibacillus sharpeae]|uniref:hypothetical protein n=1 Tax=Lacticaseibacillus sharpeae TaxID=1626 RepID=UPI0006D25F88|nr:hypothetical protein [Lacticaseibacillus sharpeae]
MSISTSPLRLHINEYKTGKEVKVNYHKITITSPHADSLHKAGWLFNWSLTAGTTVVAITLPGSNEFQGLVSYDNDDNFVNLDLIESAPYNRGKNRRFYGVGRALFAIVAQASFDYGDDGFILLKPKTRVREHFSTDMGAKEIGNGKQYIDTTSAIQLLNTFKGDDSNGK